MKKENAGLGRKFCKKCNAICGIASKTCFACEEPFEIKAKTKSEKTYMTVPQAYTEYQIYSTTAVPAGECPIPFPKAPLQKDVEDWAHKVRIHFLKKNKTFPLNSALRYYVRYVYDLYSKNHDRACLMVDKLPDIKIVKIEEGKPDEN